MFEKNKKMLLGVAGCLLVVLIVHFAFVSPNWTLAAENREKAKTANEEWEKFYKGGTNLLNKPEGETLLAENKKLLDLSMKQLKRIEFGDANTLKQFSEAAVKDGDKNNYLLGKKTAIYTRFKEVLKISGSEADLGFKDNVLNDTVGINLIRAAVVEQLLATCQRSGIERVVRVNHMSPGVMLMPDEEPQQQQQPDPKDKKKKGDEPPAIDHLVQFPIRLTLNTPEKTLGKLLFELQRPTEGPRGFVSLRNFEIQVKEKGQLTGTVDASITVVALLTESTLQALGVQHKKSAIEERSSPTPPVNVDRY